MATIGNKGTQLNLVATQGTDFAFRLKFTNPIVSPATVGLPYDFTGCTGIAQIRKKFNDDASVAAFTVTFAAIPTDGYIDFTLARSISAGMPCGVDENDAKSKYLWDFMLTDASGKVSQIVYGDVSLFREISKP